ncbi:MAG: UvrD-helicase domain-containing protein [Polyangiales bacterium]
MTDERDRLLYELPTNVVVAAGAGTGKTHRLSGLFIHLVAGLTELASGPIAPEAIVATTFTREAASEMRARIEDRLRLLAMHPLDELLAMPASSAWASELASTCARRGVGAPDRSVFRRALEALPRATISTFHSWAGEIVRAHPIEAGVPPGFALLEPEEAEAIVARATDRVASAWIEHSEPGRRVAIRQLLSSGIEPLTTAVQSALARAAEEGVDPPSLLLADTEAHVAKARARRHELLADVARGLPPRSAARQPLERAQAVALSLDRGEPRFEEFADALEALRKSVMREVEIRDRFDAMLSRKSGTIRERVAPFANEPERTAAAHLLERETRTLLSEIAGHVAAEKRRLRAIDFGDVLRRARDLLLHHPEVQAEIGGEITALLVDEFQDTNALQRDLVYLVRQSPEAIARREPGIHPEPSSLRRTGLFLVGDRKQSIYSFRGADVGVFQQIALDLAGDDARALLGLAPSDGPRVQGLGRVVSLDENRRSVDGVLRFVNALAEIDMRGHPSLGAVEQVVFRAELEALRAVRPEGDAFPRVIVPTIEAPEQEVSGDLVAAMAIAGELRTLLENEPDVRPRDIAILIRTYAALPALEFALSLHGLEHAVSAGRGLFATAEAGDLDAFVRLAIDRLDRHAVLAVLRGPWVSLSDGALLALARTHGIALPADASALDGLDEGERRRLGRLLSVLEDLDRHGARLGAAASLSRAIERLAVEETLALLPAGEARIRDLRKLVSLADRFPTGLAAFARFLAQGRAGDLDEARGAIFDEEHDAIRVLTIHASKGLEFPIVVVMQLDHAGPPSRPGPFICARGEQGLAIAARVDRDLGLGGRVLHDRAIAFDRAERQRLTYVALTRARDRLYVVSTPRKRQPDASSAAHAVSRVLEDEPELAEQRPLAAKLVALAPRARPELPPLRVAFGEGPFRAARAGSTVVTTALADYAACPRRFRLLHVVGLPEQVPRARPIELPDLDALDAPDPSTVDAESVSLPTSPIPSDPRIQGVLAHAALERAPASAFGEGAQLYAETFLRNEGWDPKGGEVADRIVRFLRSSFAVSLLDSGVRIARERPFVVALPSGVALRGTIDLVVVRPRPGGARVEIVDYKSGQISRDLSRHGFQLRAYAAACASGALADLLPEGRTEIVAGISFLGSGNGEPIWLDEGADLAGEVARIDELAGHLLDARLRGEWPGVAPARCRTLRCGFLPLCHPEVAPEDPS